MEQAIEKLGELAARAAVLDAFGPPPEGDPSAFTGPLIGREFAEDLIETLSPANEEAFAGGLTGTFQDAGINTVLSEAQQTSANVPTHGKPSPLFGAQPFTQQLLLFEEFCTDLHLNEDALKSVKSEEPLTWVPRTSMPSNVNEPKKRAGG